MTNQKNNPSITEKDIQLSILEIYQQITKDLQAIIDNLKYLYDERQKANDKENTNNYRKYEIQHYIDLNQSAQKEIIDFLCQPDKIHQKAIEESSYSQPSDITNWRAKFFKIDWYFYHYCPEIFDIRQYSELRNKAYWLTSLENVKLQEMTLKTLHQRETKELEKLEDMRKNRPQEFAKFLKDCITENQIIDKLKKSIASHHVLNEREGILAPALKFYETGQYLLFIHLIPLQIEGIFYKYCEDLGIKEVPDNFPKKLKQIYQKDKRFGDYEYFSFYFPMLRNKVAHGRFLEENEIKIAITAHLLLLDLDNVMSSITAEHLPINQMVKLVKSLYNNSQGQETITNERGMFYCHSEPPKIRDLLQLKLMIIEGFIIPDFYLDIQDYQDKLNQIIEDNEQFWDVIYCIASRSEEKEDIQILKTRISDILGRLKSEQIKVEKCTEIFKVLKSNKFQKRRGSYQDFIAVYALNYLE